jgi:hypothetical protein
MSLPCRKLSSYPEISCIMRETKKIQSQYLVFRQTIQYELRQCELKECKVVHSTAKPESNKEFGFSLCLRVFSFSWLDSPGGSRLPHS